MRWLVTAHQSLVASLGLLDVGTLEDICGDGDMEIALCFFPIVLGHLFVFVVFFVLQSAPVGSIAHVNSNSMECYSQVSIP